MSTYKAFDLYLTTISAYAMPVFLVCKEDDDENMILDDSILETESAIYGRRQGVKTVRGRVSGYCVVYTKLKKEQLLCNLTMLYKARNAVNRIERYWRRYQERKKALNTIRPFMMHWAYKPTGVLGRRIIRSLMVQN
jgi:hypothetical protein